MIRVPPGSIKLTRAVTHEDVIRTGQLASIRELGILHPPVVHETPEGPAREKAEANVRQLQREMQDMGEDAKKA